MCFSKRNMQQTSSKNVYISFIIIIKTLITIITIICWPVLFWSHRPLAGSSFFYFSSRLPVWVCCTSLAAASHRSCMFVLVLSCLKSMFLNVLHTHKINLNLTNFDWKILCRGCCHRLFPFAVLEFALVWALLQFDVGCLVYSLHEGLIWLLNFYSMHIKCIVRSEKYTNIGMSSTVQLHVFVLFLIVKLFELGKSAIYMKRIIFYYWVWQKVSFEPWYQVFMK